MREAEPPGQANDGDTGRMHDVEHKSTPGPSEQDSHRLRRVLTLREAVALGVGGTIGGGIFVLVGAAAGPGRAGALPGLFLALCGSLLIPLPHASLPRPPPPAGCGLAFPPGPLGAPLVVLFGLG